MQDATDQGTEMLRVIGYTDCTVCHADASVWLCADGTHVLDCSACGYGAILPKAAK